jgi:hypothetical protein
MTAELWFHLLLQNKEVAGQKREFLGSDDNDIAGSGSRSDQRWAPSGFVIKTEKDNEQKELNPLVTCCT